MHSEMATLKETISKAMSVLNFEVGSHFYAKTTYIVDPHSFYIIPFSLLRYLPALSKPGHPLRAEDLKEDKIVIFQRKNPDANTNSRISLDEHLRGEVQNINEDKKCDIYALDRGYIERDVTLDRMFYPSDIATMTPSVIQHCELDMCAPIGPNFSEESIEAFKFYIGTEKLSIVVRGKSIDKLKIVVYNSNPDDTATLLALTHYTCFYSGVREDGDMAMYSSNQPKLTYHHKELRIDDILNVRVQSGTSLDMFYVTPMSTYKQYLQNRADFTNMCNNAPVIKTKDFKSGTVVGVQDDAGYFYERAVILHVTEEEKAKVKLVDWGTEVEVPRRKTKELKTDFFLKTPAYALYCSAVDGFKPWDNGLSKFLYKGYNFTIKVKKVGQGFESPHIVALAPT